MDKFAKQLYDIDRIPFGISKKITLGSSYRGGEIDLIEIFVVCFPLLFTVFSGCFICKLPV